MTDQTLTTYIPLPTQAVSVADYQTRAVQRLGEWAASADAAFEVARRLVETSFVPAQFRGKPVEATAAILAGSEVGLSPMSALKAFDIIQGQAAPRAITLRAVVQSFGHELVLVESTSTRCRMKGRRAGSAEWQTVTWTIDRAKDLQLTGKDNWRKQPAAMLIARATSELARLIASDAILGIGYSAEEVADGATGDAPPTTEPDAAPAPTTGRRTLRRADTAPPQGSAESDQPPADDTPAPAEQSDDEAPVTGGGGITTRQHAKIAAGLRDLDITDAAAARAYCTRAIGREVKSRKDLSYDEASDVITCIEYDLTHPNGPDDAEADLTNGAGA